MLSYRNLQRLDRSGRPVPKLPFVKESRAASRARSENDPVARSVHVGVSASLLARNDVEVVMIGRNGTGSTRSAWPWSFGFMAKLTTEVAPAPGADPKWVRHTL